LQTYTGIVRWYYVIYVCLTFLWLAGFQSVVSMDHSPINQNFELNKSRQKFHHSLKEHHKISNPLMWTLPKFRMFRIFLNINSISYSFRSIANKMVLDIQTVHHILKNTAVQNVNKPFVYITDLTSTLTMASPWV
jgi:hypothetical protein